MAWKAFLKVTKKQTTDFGLVAILTLIFFALYLHNEQFVVAAFIVTLVTIVVPILFYPFAVVWFGLSGLMGEVSSRLILGLVFLTVVMPVGFFRKLTGKDNMKTRQFRRGKQSVMVIRNHLYTKGDLLNTF